jgi:hypothetical protein
VTLPQSRGLEKLHLFTLHYNIPNEFHSTPVLTVRSLCSMANIVLAESNPIMATVIALSMVAGVLLFLWIGNCASVKAAGWSELVKAYPANRREMTSDVFTRREAIIGQHVFTQAFKVQLGADGIRLQPSFARRLPIFVPWSKIDEVVVPVERVFGFEQDIRLSVNWYNRLQISLPHTALPAIEKRVPNDRIRKVDSSPNSIFKSGWSR